MLDEQTKKKLKIGGGIAVFVGILLLALIQRHFTGGFSAGQLMELENRLLTPHARGKKDKPSFSFKNKRPWRKGKVVVIVPSYFNVNDRDQARVHECYPKLPSEIRGRPGNVETVIFCRKLRGFAGKYSNGANAYRDSFEIWCFDADSGEYMGGKLVRGDGPPEKISSAQVIEASGEAPDLADVIDGLPLTPPSGD